HQERRLYFNSPELIQGGTQATPRVKTARISWKSLALARQHPFQRRVRLGTSNAMETKGALNVDPLPRSGRASTW
ncbi:MAG: hypothetical protein WBX00_13570, partial [Isosphaeraceae bacterium]